MQALRTICGALILSMPLVAFAQIGGPAQETASTALPDSPGAVQAAQQSSASQQNSPQQSSSQAQSPEPPPTQQTPAQQTVGQDSTLQRPVGTAAAGEPVVSGITAAQPAGVAIAPAKQRRVRTIVIKVGAIAGGAIALGTVMALTAGTSSKPPGAH